jgi:hypothetical protein
MSSGYFDVDEILPVEFDAPLVVDRAGVKYRLQKLKVH